eukprot:COSAG01_NODE_61047_length_291_cov_1.067708_1_plen_89_part_01
MQFIVCVRNLPTGRCLINPGSEDAEFVLSAVVSAAVVSATACTARGCRLRGLAILCAGNSRLGRRARFAVEGELRSIRCRARGFCATDL